MVVFFVGTAAELVKMAPVIREVKRRGAPLSVISSGQNDLRGSELWKLANVNGPDIVLSTCPIPPRASGLAMFLARTSVTGLRDAQRAWRGHRLKDVKAVVHGDTVSTLMGALLFSALGVTVHHVEAGLRSFRLTEPFPEEICRVIVSRLAHVAYCPNDWAANHLDRRNLRKIVTGGNTLYDALNLVIDSSEKQPIKRIDSPYFVLVVHRQENLLRGVFLRSIVKKIRAARARPKCIFVMHALTRAALQREGLMNELETDPTFFLLPRQPYIAFSNILARAEYLITDGGSNQEEAYYLGKPCLLMRRITERIEGLGENVLLSSDPLREIDAFMQNATQWVRPRVKLDVSPSSVIADDLCGGLTLPL
ncbi:MAG: UDP-N-acetylglucosamine 2-epimerase [Polyangiaceae bacterium]|nr:UDP-N-acetylglucosamine 2-epimerase [Polyangiaceae bacterium]